MDIFKHANNCLRNLIGTNNIERNLYNRIAYENKRQLLINHILHDKGCGIISDNYCEHNVIVSLTTYGKRINDVAFTIESIMQQSVKANKIILWIDENFKNVSLPHALILQQERGLEIGYCKDIRSYTKLLYSLRKFPDDIIITIDDDLLYEYDMIEHLILAYLQKPQYIHASRVHKILMDKNGELLPYNNWILRSKELGPNRLNFATGVGGVLYPPNSLDKEVFNEKVFLDICKYADDVWFYAMALKKGTLINKVYTRDPGGNDYLVNEGVQDLALKRINTTGDMMNDQQIKSVFDKYNLYDSLQ